MSSTTYLITGANRGLGRGLFEAYAQRPNTTVIAGVRDPSSESSKSLDSVKTGAGSKIITVKIDNNYIATINEAIQTLQSKHGIAALDVVIANAGIAKQFGPADVVPLQEVRDHHEVNVVGTLALFQATSALIKKSSKAIFVSLSSPLGSIGDMEKFPVASAAYGASKAGLNYLVRKIHFENPEIVAIALNPGWVQTDMGNFGAVSSGMAQAPLTLEQSVPGMVERIDGATREKTSGTFQSYDGGEILW